MNTISSKKLIPTVKLNKVSPIPLHFQLSTAIAASLREHKVAANTELISELSLAKELNVNRNTVSKAYRRLIEENVLVRNPGERKISVTKEFESTYKRESFPVIGLVLSDKLSTLVNHNATCVLNYITGVIDTACSFGFATTVITLPELDTPEDELHLWFNGMRKKLSGLVYLGDRPGQSHDKVFRMMLSEENISQVFIGAESKFEHLANVLVDVKSGMTSALNHLISLGHSRMGLIFIEIKKRNYLQLQSYSRFDDAVSAANDLNIQLNKDCIIRDFEDKNSLFTQISSMMQSPDRPTALLCHNDRVARLVIEILNELNLSVPENISVIGYDDDRFAVSAEPELTTIQHPRLSLGKAAVELIYDDFIGNISIKGRHQVLPCNLIIRASTGPVNQELSHNSF